MESVLRTLWLDPWGWKHTHAQICIHININKHTYVWYLLHFKFVVVLVHVMINTYFCGECLRRHFGGLRECVCVECVSVHVVVLLRSRAFRGIRPALTLLTVLDWKMKNDVLNQSTQNIHTTWMRKTTSAHAHTHNYTRGLFLDSLINLTITTQRKLIQFSDKH